jgi:hypothetical protein
MFLNMNHGKNTEEICLVLDVSIDPGTLSEGGRVKSSGGLELSRACEQYCSGEM